MIHYFFFSYLSLFQNCMFYPSAWNPNEKIDPYRVPSPPLETNHWVDRSKSIGNRWGSDFGIDDTLIDENLQAIYHKYTHTIIFEMAKRNLKWIMVRDGICRVPNDRFKNLKELNWLTTAHSHDKLPYKNNPDKW